MDSNEFTFYGQYETVLDEEGCFVIPPACAEKLAAVAEGEPRFFFFLKEQVLCLFSEQEMHRVLEAFMKAGGQPARLGWYMAQNGAGTWQPDGKTQIPEWFLERASLKKEASIVLLGVGTHLEVWDAGKLKGEMARCEEELLPDILRILDEPRN